MEGYEEDQLFGVMNLSMFGESPEMRAKQMLSQSLRDPAKMEERKVLLEQHPELRIHIDSEALKKIIPFESFKCHPDCSVARGEAIRNSDIDGGLVILSERVATKKQQQFVEALREMGFDVYHSSELAAARREYERTRDIEAQRVAGEKLSKMTFNVIEFKTRDELEKQKMSRIHDSVLNIYLAGEEVA